MSFRDLRSFILALALLVFVSGCNSDDNENNGDIVGQDLVTGAPSPVPDDSGNGAPNPDYDPTKRIGPACHSSDPNHICLALKYVAFRDSGGQPVVSDQEAIQNVAEINSLWATCDVAFEIGEFLSVEPSAYGFAYNTASMGELDEIRSEFEDDKTLLVATTGTWSGSLGALATNAWTMMPGSYVQGVVMEEPVATSPKLIAHELGHYLNLGHVSDSSNMMNPVIYQSSVNLSSSQCGAARSAAKYYWSAMYR